MAETSATPLDSIRVVLVRPQVPGNIGATARAMKAMGLSQLWLVAPHSFPHHEATRRATEAQDVLDATRVVSTLAEALQNCTLTIATSVRPRRAAWPMVNPEQAAASLLGNVGPSALIFGPEPSGLSSEELHAARLCSVVPTGPASHSLNLSHAVQIYAYELQRAVTRPSQDLTERPTQRQLDQLFDDFDQLLAQLDMVRRAPDPLRLRAVFNRSDLSRADWSLLQGMVKRIRQRLVPDDSEDSS